MGLLNIEQVISAVEAHLGKSLDDTGRGCVQNAVEGYNGGKGDYQEIKASLREGVVGLLSLGDNDLVALVDATEMICDEFLRKAIPESN